MSSDARYRLGKITGEGVIVGRNRHGCRQACADLLGKRRPRQYGHRHVRPEHLGRDLVRQFARAELEALGGPAHARILGQERLDARQRVAQAVARDDDEHIPNAVETGLEIGAGPETGRKLDAGEIPLVFAVLDHGLEEVQLDDAAEPNIATHPCELHGQRGSPGTGADNGNRRGGRVVDQCASVWTPCSSACCFACMYSASKLIGCSTNSGKPPFWIIAAMDSLA